MWLLPCLRPRAHSTDKEPAAGQGSIKKDVSFEERKLVGWDQVALSQSATQLSVWTLDGLHQLWNSQGVETHHTLADLLGPNNDLSVVLATVRAHSMWAGQVVEERLFLPQQPTSIQQSPDSYFKGLYDLVQRRDEGREGEVEDHAGGHTVNLCNSFLELPTSGPVLTSQAPQPPVSSHGDLTPACWQHCAPHSSESLDALPQPCLALPLLPLPATTAAEQVSEACSSAVPGRQEGAASGPHALPAAAPTSHPLDIASSYLHSISSAYSMADSSYSTSLNNPAGNSAATPRGSLPIKAKSMNSTTLAPCSSPHPSPVATVEEHHTGSSSMPSMQHLCPPSVPPPHHTTSQHPGPRPFSEAHHAISDPTPALAISNSSDGDQGEADGSTPASHSSSLPCSLAQGCASESAMPMAPAEAPISKARSTTEAQLFMLSGHMHSLSRASLACSSPNKSVPAPRERVLASGSTLYHPNRAQLLKTSSLSSNLPLRERSLMMDSQESTVMYESMVARVASAHPKVSAMLQTLAASSRPPTAAQTVPSTSRMFPEPSHQHGPGDAAHSPGSPSPSTPSLSLSSSMFQATTTDQPGKPAAAMGGAEDMPQLMLPFPPRPVPVHSLAGSSQDHLNCSVTDLVLSQHFHPTSLQGTKLEMPTPKSTHFSSTDHSHLSAPAGPAPAGPAPAFTDFPSPAAVPATPGTEEHAGQGAHQALAQAAQEAVLPTCASITTPASRSSSKLDLEVQLLGLAEQPSARVGIQQQGSSSLAFLAKPAATSRPEELAGAPGHLAVRSVKEVVVRCVQHPQTLQQVLLVSQCDITVRSQLEDLLVQVTDSQLQMVSQMFPHHIIAYLACNNGRGLNPSMSMSSVATGHHDVTLLFMDIVGFTSMSKAISAGEVMAFLNELFSLYDRLVERHGVHKVETAGDCYIVSAGVVAQGSDGYMHVLTSHDAADSARRVLSFAKDMLAAAQKVRMPHNQEPACIRIGLHTGDCTSGLIGSRLPKFSIFGDSMNTASRMESTAPPGRIQVTEATYRLLPHEQWEPTGGVEVKGKGLMQTFLWLPHLAAVAEGDGEELLSSTSLHQAAGAPGRTSSAHLPKHARVSSQLSLHSSQLPYVTSGADEAMSSNTPLYICGGGGRTSLPSLAARGTRRPSTYILTNPVDEAAPAAVPRLQQTNTVVPSSWEVQAQAATPHPPGSSQLPSGPADLHTSPPWPMQRKQSGLAPRGMQWPFWPASRRASRVEVDSLQPSEHYAQYAAANASGGGQASADMALLQRASSRTEHILLFQMDQAGSGSGPSAPLHPPVLHGPPPSRLAHVAPSAPSASLPVYQLGQMRPLSFTMPRTYPHTVDATPDDESLAPAAAAAIVVPSTAGRRASVLLPCPPAGAPSRGPPPPVSNLAVPAWPPEAAAYNELSLASLLAAADWSMNAVVGPGMIPVGYAPLVAVGPAPVLGAGAVAARAPTMEVWTGRGQDQAVGGAPGVDPTRPAIGPGQAALRRASDLGPATLPSAVSPLGKSAHGPTTQPKRQGSMAGSENLDWGIGQLPRAGEAVPLGCDTPLTPPHAASASGQVRPAMTRTSGPGLPNSALDLAQVPSIGSLRLAGAAGLYRSSLLVPDPIQHL